MVMKYRIVFLIAALVSLCLCILVFLGVLNPHWGIEYAVPLGNHWGIAFLLTWAFLEGLHTWCRVKAKALQCPHCDHSLRGLKCPECGERLDSTSDAE